MLDSKSEFSAAEGNRIALSASVSTSSYLLFGGCLPLALTLLSTGEPITASRIGTLVSSYYLGGFVGSLWALRIGLGERYKFWLGLWAAAAAGAAICVSTSAATRFDLAAIVIVGICLGAINSSLAMLASRLPNPTSAFGLQLSIGAMPGTIILALLPWLTRVAWPNPIDVLAVIMLLCCTTIVLLPRAPPAAAEPQTNSSEAGRAGPASSVLILYAAFMLNAVWIGIWAFGVKFFILAGWGDDATGRMLSATSALSIVQAMLCTLLNGNRRNIGPYLMASSVCVLGLFLSSGRSSVMLPLGYMLFVGTASMVLPLTYGMAARVDHSGRLNALAAATATIASIVGSALVGFLLDSAYSGAVLPIAAACFASAAAAALAGEALSHKRTRSHAHI